jgi:hypothetical protein
VISFQIAPGSGRVAYDAGMDRLDDHRALQRSRGGAARSGRLRAGPGLSRQSRWNAHDLRRGRRPALGSLGRKQPAGTTQTVRWSQVAASLPSGSRRTPVG